MPSFLQGSRPARGTGEQTPFSACLHGLSSARPHHCVGVKAASSLALLASRLILCLTTSPRATPAPGLGWSLASMAWLPGPSGTHSSLWPHIRPAPRAPATPEGSQHATQTGGEGNPARPAFLHLQGLPLPWSGRLTLPGPPRPSTQCRALCRHDSSTYDNVCVFCKLVPLGTGACRAEAGLFVTLVRRCLYNWRAK